MSRIMKALAMAAVAFGFAGQSMAEDQKVTYAVTTTNISVGHAAQSSIPVAAGFWKEQGLDVDVIGIKGATAGIQQVASGQVDFATVGPEALLIARSKGVNVKGVYIFARKPIYRIVALPDSGIKTPADLKGKTLGVPNMSVGSVPFAKAVLKTAKVDPDADIQWLAVGLGATAANAFRQKDVDAYAAWDTAVAGLENGGMKFTYINPPWMGELMGNLMIAREDTIKEKPDLLVKVARGIAMGSTFGLENPDAAIRNHWKMYPETKPQNMADDSLDKARHIFNSRFELLKPGEGEKWGESIGAQWKRAADMAITENLIPKDFDVTAAYTNEFIDEINKFDEKGVVEKASNSDW